MRLTQSLPKALTQARGLLYIPITQCGLELCAELAALAALQPRRYMPTSKKKKRGKDAKGSREGEDATTEPIAVSGAAGVAKAVAS